MQKARARWKNAEKFSLIFVISRRFCAFRIEKRISGTKRRNSLSLKMIAKTTDLTDATRVPEKQQLIYTP